MSAKEYWEKRFEEYPQSDADKLAVAMMAEYAKEVAIDFAQWLREDRYENIGYKKFEVAGKSTEKLYHLYLKSKTQ